MSGEVWQALALRIFMKEGEDGEGRRHINPVNIVQPVSIITGNVN